LESDARFFAWAPLKSFYTVKPRFSVNPRLESFVNVNEHDRMMCEIAAEKVGQDPGLASLASAPGAASLPPRRGKGKGKKTKAEPEQLVEAMETGGADIPTARSPKGKK
jgi:hypothetical protein